MNIIVLNSYKLQTFFFFSIKKINYAIQNENTNVIKEGGKSFQFGLVLSFKRDAEAIVFILRVFKSKIKIVSGTKRSPSRFVIDFDQGSKISFKLFFLFFQTFFLFFFEKKASIPAIQEVFPESEIYLCYFHLMQAIIKKAITHFQGLVECDEHLNAKTFAEVVVRIEFQKFWLSTNRVEDLEENLEVIYIYFFFNIFKYLIICQKGILWKTQNNSQAICRRI